MERSTQPKGGGWRHVEAVARWYADAETEEECEQAHVEILEAVQELLRLDGSDRRKVARVQVRR